jgi:hypothetical protein
LDYAILAEEQGSLLCVETELRNLPMLKQVEKSITGVEVYSSSGFMQISEFENPTFGTLWIIGIAIFSMSKSHNQT